MSERSAAGFVRTLVNFEAGGVSVRLVVRAEAVTTVIYFHNGALVFAEGGTPGEALGRVLVDDGSITEDQFVEAIRVMTDSLVDDEQMRLGEVLVRLGYLGLEDVQEALARQVRRKVMRCLQWDKMVMQLDEPRSEERHGHFPVRVEPLVLEGVRRFVERERMMALLKPHVGRYGALRDRASVIAQRMGMSPEEGALITRLDGSTRLYELLRELAERRPDPIPVVAALVLADLIEPHAEAQLPKPVEAPAPEARARRRRAPAVATPARSRLAQGAAGRASAFRARSEARKAPLAPDARSPHDRGASARAAAPLAPAKQQVDASPLPRRGRRTSEDVTAEAPVRSRSKRRQDELPRRRRPTWRDEDELPRRRRPTWSSDDDPRRERPTWRNVEELPRRERGTHRALGEMPPDGAPDSERTPDPPRAPDPVSAPDPASAPNEPVVDTKLVRLEAEQAYQRGLRLLWAERFDRAEVELQRASDALPEVADYALCATWARYRQAKNPQQLEELREELNKWVRRAARQDRGLAFPPYVAAHLELVEGDEAKALRYFRIAAERNPGNIDAKRYVRLLDKRLG